MIYVRFDSCGDSWREQGCTPSAPRSAECQKCGKVFILEAPANAAPGAMLEFRCPYCGAQNRAVPDLRVFSCRCAKLEFWNALRSE